jgi:predicted outer membrane protein
MAISNDIWDKLIELSENDFDKKGWNEMVSRHKSLGINLVSASTLGLDDEIPPERDNSYEIINGSSVYSESFFCLN